MTAAVVAGPLSAAAVAQTMPGHLVKAAFVFNFARFTEWPSLAPGGRLEACVFGDDSLAAALAATTRGQQIAGRAIEVSQPPGTAAWAACHLLFVADGRAREFVQALPAIRTQPVLTISDGNDFARLGGIIELFLEDGRMRFAINTTAADRAGLRLSSRLLGLATIIREPPEQ